MSKNERVRTVDMLNGPLLRKMILFAMPLAASSILQQLFNSADVAVVGHFAGSEAMAAVGSNSPVTGLFVNMVVGFSVGANVIVAKLIGEGKEQRIKEAIKTILTVALICGFALLAIGLFMARPILELMQAPEDVIEQAIWYLRIYCMGMPFIVVYNFGAAILNSKGDTKHPLYCLMFSGILNVILNLFLVLVFQLGVIGVAIATNMSNLVSAMMVLYFLKQSEEPVRLEWKGMLHIDRKILTMVAVTGIPAGVQSMMFSISNIVIQTAINGFGAKAIAGNTATLNFEYFVYFVINAFNQTVVTFTSQNYGARKLERCKKVFRLAIMCSMSVTFTMGMILVAGGTFFPSLYTPDQEAIAYAVIRINCVALFQSLANTYELSGSALRGLGYSMVPTVITVFGTCLLRPLWVVTVFARFKTINSLLYVYPVSWLLTGIVMLIVYIKIQNKTEQKIQMMSVENNSI